MPKRTLTIAGLMLLAGIALAACAAPAGGPGQPGTSLSGSLTGNVTYRERIALDPSAVIEVELLDVSKADAPAEVIASQTIEADGKQVPIPFELTYDPAKIDPRFTYAVAARILVNGELRWISQESNRVLTQGNPTSNVEIVVGAVPAGTHGLPDQEWTLRSMVVDGVEVGLEESVSTTIRFAADGKYSGSGGCNNYTGSYTRQGNTISLGGAAATLKACPTGMEQEAKFFATLPQVSTFEITAEGLRLSSADGQTTLAFGDSGSSQASITGAVWKWTGSIDNSGKTTTAPNPDDYTLEFKSDGTIAVRADCNIGGGSYQLDGNQLTITLGVMTLVACPSGSLDGQYLKELGEVSSYLFEGQDLILEWKLDSGTMRFTQ